MIGVLPWVRDTDDAQAVAMFPSFWKPFDFLETQESRLREVLSPDEDGATPVHIAVHKGHVEVLKALHKLGADLETKNKDGDTPLSIALKEGHQDVKDFIETAIKKVRAALSSPLLLPLSSLLFTRSHTHT